MSKIRAAFVPAVIIVLCAGPIGAATITWDGSAGDGSWHTAANWDLNRVPGSGDFVQIPDLPETSSISFTTGSTTISSMGCDEKLTLSGGTLSIGLASYSAKSLTIQGGTLAGSGNMEVYSAFEFRSGAMTGSGKTVIGSGVLWELGNDGVPCTLTRTLENFGQCRHSFGNLIINSPGVFRNIDDGGATSGWLDLYGNGSIVGTGSLINESGCLIARYFSDSISSINCVVTNDGSIQVWGGHLTLGGSLTNLSGGTLAGGHYAVHYGELTVPGDIVTNASTINATFPLTRTAGGSALQNLQSNTGSLSLTVYTPQMFNSLVTNSGTVEIRGLTTLNSGYRQTAGSTTITGNGQVISNATFDIQDGELRGGGVIQGNVVNDGIISIGTIQTNWDSLDVQGTYVQTSGGSLQFEVTGGSGPTRYDRLRVTGTATLNGSAQVTFPISYIPGVHEAFPLITASSIMGAFSSVTLPSVAPNCTILDYGPQSVSFEIVEEDCFQTNWNSEWFAAANTLPDQACTWVGVDNAAPENPTLYGGILTIATSEFTENMYYGQHTGLAIPDRFLIQARMRLVSSSHAAGTARRGASINFTVAPRVSNILHVGRDTVFIWSDVSVQGPTAYVDTDDAFHTYTIEVLNRQTVHVYQDDVLILTGATIFSLNFVDHPYLYFGEGTDATYGVSEWQYVRHNANTNPCGNVSGVHEVAVPGPPLEVSMAPDRNPSRGPLTLTVRSPRDLDSGRLTICDVGGRVIRSLETDALREGITVLRWDGRDDRGRAVSNGIYFLRLESGERIIARTRAVMFR